MDKTVTIRMHDNTTTTITADQTDEVAVGITPQGALRVRVTNKDGKTKQESCFADGQWLSYVAVDVVANVTSGG